MTDVTRILQAMERGEPQAMEQLLPLVYEELRQLAAMKMAREQPGQTLQPTALVHEAWLRLMKSPLAEHPSPPTPLPPGENAENGDKRRYFFAAAAEAMRRILVERYRQKQSLKRGAGADKQSADDISLKQADHILDVHEALDGLHAVDPVAAELVKLRYFAGCTHAEAAAVLDLPLRSADRLWSFARAWLFRDLSEHSE
ncbi:MAG: RNA polymerase subunit sigma [Planctomycetia bacterium]|nr:RNA polymerase subunit sigma [Planctomycetia bacterium]